MDSKKIEAIKQKYPEGTKIKLIEMFNEPQMKSGLIGTVDMIDGIGQIHVRWENGSSLALNEDVDNFEIIKTEE